MGLDVDPKPGFDHWACFRGQGTYFNPELNVNGTLQTLEGFTDDVTTRQACDWIASAPDRPSLTILGYKSCHSPFDPAPRAANLYSDVRIAKPATFDKPAPDRSARIDRPARRYGRHLHHRQRLPSPRARLGSTTTSAMYEEIIRVPLLVRYPRLIPQGRRVDETVPPRHWRKISVDDPLGDKKPVRGSWLVARGS